jgi:hypothetical protein
MPFGPRPLLYPRSTTLLRCRVLPGYTAAYEQTPSKHASLFAGPEPDAVAEVSAVGENGPVDNDGRWLIGPRMFGACVTCEFGLAE